MARPAHGHADNLCLRALGLSRQLMITLATSCIAEILGTVFALAAGGIFLSIFLFVFNQFKS